ncbi:MAG: hypothetical protein IKA72_00840 [Clostridia bacterium]|nr:hypothetical protein [Clostridia bacterium]
MELIDFDGLFDERLAQYIENNKEKYTEKQWEDIIPKLYKKFGDTQIKKLGCSPKGYYAKMTEVELVETLYAHLTKDVPVPEFLCAEIENRDTVPALLGLLEKEEECVANYVVNLIGADRRAKNAYFSILTNEKFDEELRSDVTDLLRSYADEIKAETLAYYREGKACTYMLEILSRVKEREEEIFETLLNAFLSEEENLRLNAGYLASYGDERALPYLLNKIEDRSLGFVEFQELKYAIEALGGSYDEPRDFSADKDYIAVEASGVRSANELKN